MFCENSTDLIAAYRHHWIDVFSTLFTSEIVWQRQWLISFSHCAPGRRSGQPLKWGVEIACSHFCSNVLRLLKHSGSRRLWPVYKSRLVYCQGKWVLSCGAVQSLMRLIALLTTDENKVKSSGLFSLFAFEGDKVGCVNQDGTMNRVVACDLNSPHTQL